jgi:hypothetical protein
VTAARLRVPGHVVYRELVRETAVFDLRTGAYQSLPRTAGVVLSLIDRHGSVDRAAAELARKTGRPLASSASCLASHCHELRRVGLLEVDRRPFGPQSPGPRSQTA